jgi:selenocysteine lyase/cysteine desulfurase
VSLADEVRGQFPILSVNGGGGRPLVYLDSAATSQKPLVVRDASRRFQASISVVLPPVIPLFRHRSAHCPFIAS